MDWELKRKRKIFKVMEKGFERSRGRESQALLSVNLSPILASGWNRIPRRALWDAFNRWEMCSSSLRNQSFPRLLLWGINRWMIEGYWCEESSRKSKRKGCSECACHDLQQIHHYCTALLLLYQLSPPSGPHVKQLMMKNKPS